MSIEYTDGGEVEASLLRLVDQAADLSSDAALAPEHYGEWAIRYHLSPERANLLRHLDFEGLSVLELGAGMGAVSRFLAERAKALTVVEGTKARFAVLSARLRDLSNWSGVVTNIQDAELPGKFDVVCVVGALEYSELYISPSPGSNPFSTFLKKAGGFLKEDGALILAIENRLGLKYWSGAPEDHTGRLFDGICGYGLKKSPRTFSRRELRALIEGAGFAEIVEHFPFPDYKIPSTVLSADLMAEDPELAADLATTHAYSSYGPPRMHYFPDVLAMRGLARSGLLPEFANSFLFIAGRTPGSATLRRLLSGANGRGELAWHYSARRRVPIGTVFLREGNGTLVVEKRNLRPDAPGILHCEDHGLAANWKQLARDEVIPGTPLRLFLAKEAYGGDWEAFLARLKRFLSWSMERWGQGGANQLSGDAVDAVILNAMVPEGGTEPFRLFDLEWATQTPVPATWFVFRNVFSLIQDFSLFSSKAPFGNFKELYEKLCGELGLVPDLKKDEGREAAFQALTSAHADAGYHADELRQLFLAPFPDVEFPRDPSVETRLRAELFHLREENERMRKVLETLPHRAARKLNDELERVPAVQRLVLGGLGGLHRWVRWRKSGMGDPNQAKSQRSRPVEPPP